MRFLTLGSGSSGNAAVVCAGNTAVLIDSGFTIKETVRRLKLADYGPQDLSAIVVTHEHGDHLSGVAPFARKYPVPVWMTHGTYRAARDKNISQLNLFHSEQPFYIGDLRLDPFPTPHDAAESCHFVFSHKEKRLGFLTDLGCTTPYLIKKLSNLDALLLECNYDSQMLRDGPYGSSLQARIRSDYGHLDNVQAANFLKKIDTPRLKKILLGHLSEKNNSPDRVIKTFEDIVPNSIDRLSILKQSDVSQWHDISDCDQEIYKPAPEYKDMEGVLV